MNNNTTRTRRTAAEANGFTEIKYSSPAIAEAVGAAVKKTRNTTEL